MAPAQPPRTAAGDERALPTLEARVEALAALAWTTRDDPARAASMARQAAALADSGDASPRARALVLAARAHMATLEGDQDAAVQLGTSALEGLGGPDDAIWQCRLLGDVAVAESMLGRLVEAQPLYERGRSLAGKEGLRKEEFRFLYNLAELHMCAGRTDEALPLMQEARVLATRIGDRRLQGLALENEGNLYRVLGAYPEAVTCLLAALEHLEPLEEQPYMAIAYYDLATVYSQTGQHAEAIAAAQQAVDCFEDAPDSLYSSNALAALAYVHLKAGNHDIAVEATKQGLAVREQLGLPVESAASILMLGDIHVEAGRLEEAEARFTEGLELAGHFDEPRVSLGCRAGLAAVLKARGQAAEALKLAEPLIEAWEDIGEKQTLADVHDLVAELQEALGDSAAALGTAKRGRAVREELFNRESDARLQHLQVTHEVTREREKAAAALRDLSRQVMESHEKERKRVARDLHDDLSQRLALLAVQLDMLARTPPSSRDALRERIDTLADSARVVEDHVHRISHQLHPATLEQLGLVAATRSVCAETALAYETDIAVLADELSKLPDEIELALYRIFQEALRNAVRHGRAKSISVHLFEDAEGVCLQVRDEGIGFDPEASGAGLGLVGMRERAEHLGGRLTIRSAVGRGTFTEVCVPRPSDGA